MVASPTRGHVDPYAAMQQQIDDLKRQVVNLANKTLYSASIGAGGITVDGGEIVIQNSGGIQLPLGGAITDSSGDIIFSADRTNGGRLSTPFIPQPMYPQFTSRSTGGTGTPTVLNSDIFNSDHTVYLGQIPQVTHSGFWWNFSAGYASGTGIVTVKLWVNGVLMDSFTAASGAGLVNRTQSIYSLYVANTVFGSSNVQALVTMNSNTNDSSQVWLQPFGFAQVGQ